MIARVALVVVYLAGCVSLGFFVSAAWEYARAALALRRRDTLREEIGRWVMCARAAHREGYAEERAIALAQVRALRAQRDNLERRWVKRRGHGVA